MGQTYFNGLLWTYNDGSDLRNAVFTHMQVAVDSVREPEQSAPGFVPLEPYPPSSRWIGATPAADRPLIDAESANRRVRVRTVRVFDRLCRQHQARHGAS